LVDKSSQKNEYPEREKQLMQEIIKTNFNEIKRYGTYGYMPLEMILMAENYTYAVDVWSVDIIFLLLLSKRSNMVHLE